MGTTVSNQLVPGSVAAVAKENNRSLATAFLDCTVLILCDTSGSMASPDSTAGRSRYEQACHELKALQAELPGKIGILSFADLTEFCPNGVPRFLSGGTNLTGALQYAKQFDIAGSEMRFILISDGLPNDEASALALAKTFHNRIDVIYVGSEVEASGRHFLRRLSQAAGGQTVSAQRVIGMADEVRKLLSVN